MPNRLRQATVAIEDRRFWQHGGVDYEGILRAGDHGPAGRRRQRPGRIDADDAAGQQHLPAVQDQGAPQPQVQDHPGEARQRAGGPSTRRTGSSRSTSTTSPTEASAARTAIGVGAASQMFFDKPVADARPRADRAARRAAAGAVRVQPVPRTRGAARQRRAEVLQAMAQAGYITRAQAHAANALRLQVKANDTYQTVQQPYVFDYVKQQLINRLRRARRRRRRPQGLHDDQPPRPGTRAARRCATTRASPATRPPHWSRSTRTTATSWRCRTRSAYGAGDQFNYADRCRSARPARRSRCSC